MLDRIAGNTILIIDKNKADELLPIIEQCISIVDVVPEWERILTDLFNQLRIVSNNDSRIENYEE